MKVTLREIGLLILAVALALGWYVDHRRQSAGIRSRQEMLEKADQRAEEAEMVLMATINAGSELELDEKHRREKQEK